MKGRGPQAPRSSHAHPDHDGLDQLPPVPVPDRKRRTRPVEYELDDTLDDAKVTIAAAFGKAPKGIRYFYDMGDIWLHDVKLIAVENLPAHAEQAPTCLAGA
jgi:hypothetical protein